MKYLATAAVATIATDVAAAVPLLIFFIFILYDNNAGF